MSPGLGTDPAASPRSTASAVQVLEDGEAASGADAGDVCLVISSFRPRIGGAERVTERLGAELRRQGVRVVVLTRRYPGLPRRDSIGGVPVHRLGRPAGGKVGALTFAVHCLWALAGPFSRCRVVHVQNPDTPLLVGLIARLCLRRRLFFTAHSMPETLFDRKRWTGRLRLRLAARLAEGILVLTDAMAQDLASRGVPGDRLHVIAGGIDLETFHPPTPAERRRCRARLEVPGGTLVFLFVGRLVQLKQVDLLLRAWSLPSTGGARSLLIVGEGPEEERLRGLSAELNLSDVRFEPFTDRIADYLMAADAFVLPSRMEGLSAALVEAMATGLAVVASDLPGNRAVIEHRRSGLIVPRRDVRSLAEALRELECAELRARLGAAAARIVSRDYSLRAYARKHRKLYDERSPADARRS